MTGSIVARNYADTLFALAQRHGGAPTIDAYAAALDELAALLEREPRVRQFLETPRVSTAAKQAVLRRALTGRAPELFVRFVLVLIEKRRQRELRAIAAAYADRVDRALGRVRVQVSLAQAPEPAFASEIQRALEGKLGTRIVPTFRVDPALLGGVVVRMGDEVLDGSLRRGVDELRRRMRGTGRVRAAVAA